MRYDADMKLGCAMKIDSDSEEMKWILVKFLKDSLDFLSSESAVGTSRKGWIKAWMVLNLGDEQIPQWMPNDK